LCRTCPSGTAQVRFPCTCARFFGPICPKIFRNRFGTMQPGFLYEIPVLAASPIPAQPRPSRLLFSPVKRERERPHEPASQTENQTSSQDPSSVLHENVTLTAQQFALLLDRSQSTNKVVPNDTSDVANLRSLRYDVTMR
jgi:hypothetical protein